MNREQRIRIAEETLESIEQGFYINQYGVRIDFKEAQDFAEKNTMVYSPVELDIMIGKQPAFTHRSLLECKVIRDSTLNAARQIIAEGCTGVLCLNFASARNPGGGFQNGSSAQEESIARATGLYPCISECNDYYYTNRQMKSCTYSDYMIYSPEVPILKDELGVYLDDFKKVSIITAPAVNANIVKQRESELIPQIETIMKRRIEMLLRISIENNHKNLILGAWGCGVFGNDPNDVARYFKEVIEQKYSTAFEKVFFAIYSRDERILKPFIEHFGE